MGMSRLLFCGLVALATASYAAEPPAQVLYRGVTVIDVTGGPARKNMAILTKGEAIVAITPASAAPPSGTAIVDLPGLYASPGLINSHEHLSTPPDRAGAEAVMKKDVYGGVTAMRDMADDLRQVADLARASLVGEIPGPDIYYAALFAGPEFFEDTRVEAVSRGVPLGDAPWMRKIAATTDLRQVIAEARGTGATAIKIYADLPPDQVAAIVTEAHRQHLLTWAHGAVFPTKPDDEALAGVDTMSHVCMLAYQASDTIPHAYHKRAPVDEAKFANGIDPSVAKVFADMKAHDIILDATLLVYEEMAADYAADPKGPKPYCAPTLASRLTTAAYRAGVMISTGTDSSSKPENPWPVLQDEMELLQDKAGLKPIDVIRAATLTGAMTMHQDDKMGSIAAGKLANIVFTRDDPTKSVHAYRSLVLTVKRGAPFWRKDMAVHP